MKYSYLLFCILILLIGVPALAATGPFDVLRSNDASAVRTSPLYDSTTASPYNDATGVLSDGQSYSYLIRDSLGAYADLTLTKDRANDRVLLSFNDTAMDESPINVTTVGDQSQPGVGQATNGGSVMVWKGEDADGDGILARVFNSDGSPVGGEFGVNTTTTGDQTNPDIAVAADRRFVVVWESADADLSGIYAQLFDPNGLPVGGETRVNIDELDSQVDPGVVMADDGSYVVVWEGSDSDGSGIYARMFDTFGQPISNEFVVNTDQTGNQENPQTAMTGDGRFVVLWQSTSGSDGIFAQIYNAAGSPIGMVIDVHLGLNGQEGVPRVAMSDTGAFTAVWQGDDAIGMGTVARSFDAVGLPFTPTEIIVSTSNNGKQDKPDVAMADDGQYLVVWHDHSSKEIRGQRFDSVSAPLGVEILVSDPNATQPDAPSASLAGDATSYLVLYEAQDGDGVGVFASWVPLL